MKVKGYFYVMVSVTFFAIMTIFVKILTARENISAIEITFFRFLIGFILVNSIVIIRRIKIVPVNKKALYARAFFNTSAVILFFITIQLSSVTKANIYNLTYPIFVVIFASIFLNEKFTFRKFIIVIIGFLGTFIISGYRGGNVDIGDLMGILCGLVAGIAITSLKWARLKDDSFTILYYLMNLGFFLNLILVIPFFIYPTVNQLLILILIGFLSYFGQFALTYSYKFLSATEGAVLSSFRIFLAAIFGYFLLGEQITWNILVGGIIIFLSIIFITIEENKK